MTDRGLGDTVERALDAAGVGPLAKKAIKRLTGRPCRCGQRRDWLNKMLPYSKGKDMAATNNAPQIAVLQANITDANCQIAAINSAAAVKVALQNQKIANWQAQLTTLQAVSQSPPAA